MATLADLTALEAAINQGALRVKYEDKEVTYRTLAEMNQIRNRMRRELGMADTSGNRKTPTFDKGL